jgi:hypothetical protein
MSNPTIDPRAYRQHGLDVERMYASGFGQRQPGDYVLLSGVLRLAWCQGAGHANEGYDLPAICLEPGCGAALPEVAS